MNIKQILPALLILTMASCSAPDDHKSGADTINSDTPAKPANKPQAATSLCFIRTEKRDTTSVEMIIKGTAVTGQMNWLPFEKDSRKGTLRGVIKNDTINAIWDFEQEGMKDTLALQFVIKDDKLIQRPLKVNSSTGRQQTDRAAEFTVLYHPSVTIKR